MEMKVDSLTITRPDDWHLHLRYGAAMAAVLPDTARVFGRAIIMPNLKIPVTAVLQAWEYYEAICAEVKRLDLGHHFQPLMTLYLTDNTSPDEIVLAKKSGIVHAVKLYPAGATTNSAGGVTDIRKVRAVLEKMQEVGMPLLIHGEVTSPNVDVFDRERVFIDRVLRPLINDFPNLKIVLEHVTTQEAVEFVIDVDRLAATITAHHLIANRNNLLADGINPHLYCKPILKRDSHRQALIVAATSGNPKFFLGTDSAPHAKGAKESACGCAGCYTAHTAMGLYAEAFDSVGKLDKLEGFASHFGPDFYGLPRNTDTITLVHEDQKVPEELPFGNDVVIPLRAGGVVRWRVQA